jgi:hypothetical protein
VNGTTCRWEGVISYTRGSIRGHYTKCWWRKHLLNNHIGGRGRWFTWITLKFCFVEINFEKVKRVNLTQQVTISDFRIDCWHWISVGIRDNTLSLATGYRLDDRGIGVGVPVGVSISSLQIVQTGSEAHPVTGGPSQWVKRPGAEVDHSPQNSAEVKNTWIYTSTPHTSSCFSAWLVKHTDIFIF